MKDQLARLYELQKLDSGVRQREQWIAELDDGRRARRKYQEAAAALETLQGELQQWEHTYRTKELELKGAETERQDKAKRAYGGSVGDSKELAALERKIEELKRRAGVLEDDLLSLMERIEARREEVVQQEKLTRKLKHLAQGMIRDYREAREKFEGEIAGLQAQREGLVSQVEPALLQEYEALRAKLDGVAVAAIAGELCQACRNVVPSGLVGQVKLGKAAVKCQNCRRILFLAE